ncbi:MAG: DNA repair protein RecO [Lachnospiraceae bacterium]|nr:DNA repair protein RecO [Lachnospiraceae bacterium]
MGVSKFRGIIIKESDVGEADKILTFFTKEYGKLHVRAKGARKAKSKYMASSQIFSYGDFVVFTGNNFKSLTQADIIEGFYDIRTDYEKLAYGSAVLEIVDKSTYEESENQEILRLILRTLQNLNKKDSEGRLIFSAFIFKYLQISGYTPELTSCVECGEEIDLNNLYFGTEGLLCKNCRNNSSHSTAVNYAAVYALNYIIDSDIKNMYNFKADKNTVDNLRKMADIFLENLDLNLKSLELLENI